MGSTDLKMLMEDGRSLRVGEETSWKWQSDNGVSKSTDTVQCAHESSRRDSLTIS